MNKSMKVFLLHTDVSPYRLPLFEELAKHVDLQVYHCQYKSKRRKWSVPLSDYTFKNKILLSFKIGPFMINPTVIYELLLNKYDVYVIGEDQRVFFTKIAVFLMAKIYSKPVVLWSGMVEVNYYEYYKNIIDKYIFNIIGRLYYNLASSFVAYSQATKRYLIDNGAEESKIFTGTQVLSRENVFGIFVDKDNRANSGFKDKLVILCVSYFDKRKGIDVLIKAVNKLNRKDVSLIILGSGSEEASLKKLAKNNKNILFPGYLEKEKKAYYYSIADVFVLPTFSDAWGLVVNEAMMFGLPIILTHDAGCSEELVSGNGYVVNSGNVEELSDALNKIFNDK